MKDLGGQRYTFQCQSLALSRRDPWHRGDGGCHTTHFLALLARFCDRVFDNLEPRTVWSRGLFHREWIHRAT